MGVGGISGALRLAVFLRRSWLAGAAAASGGTRTLHSQPGAQAPGRHHPLLRSEGRPHHRTGRHCPTLKRPIPAAHSEMIIPTPDQQFPLLCSSIDQNPAGVVRL